MAVAKVSQSQLKKGIKERVDQLGGTNITASHVNVVIDALVAETAEWIEAGNRVDLFGLATLGFKYVKPIRKGTQVRNPATGETQAHAGRAAKLGAKAVAGSKLKAALPGITTKAGKAVVAGLS